MTDTTRPTGWGNYSETADLTAESVTLRSSCSAASLSDLPGFHRTRAGFEAVVVESVVTVVIVLRIDVEATDRHVTVGVVGVDVDATVVRFDLDVVVIYLALWLLLRRLRNFRVRHGCSPRCSPHRRHPPCRLIVVSR